MRYDDGFVAYLNGVEVARANFTGTPQWDSEADGNHEADSVEFDLQIDISSYIGALRAGHNVLAIHGLNTSVSSSDFIISAELEAVITEIDQEFPFAGELALLDGLRITELMYHAEDGSDFDFIELQNISDVTLELTGVRFTEGIEFIFPQMLLGPGQYVVVVSDIASFQSEYGVGIPPRRIAGEYVGNLSNGGEEIVLKLAYPLEAAVMRFAYDDRWYPLTDGGGKSLVIMDPLAHPATWNYAESWQPADPTPGRP
jgi:hypothetical protein